MPGPGHPFQPASAVGRIHPVRDKSVCLARLFHLQKSAAVQPVFVLIRDIPPPCQKHVPGVKPGAAKIHLRHLFVNACHRKALGLPFHILPGPACLLGGFPDEFPGFLRLPGFRDISAHGDGKHIPHMGFLSGDPDPVVGDQDLVFCFRQPPRVKFHRQLLPGHLIPAGHQMTDPVLFPGRDIPQLIQHRGLLHPVIRQDLSQLLPGHPAYIHMPRSFRGNSMLHKKMLHAPCKYRQRRHHGRGEDDADDGDHCAGPVLSHGPSCDL